MNSRLFLGLLVITIFFFLSYMFYNYNNETIKVGILHSSTGNMAISEQSVIDATMFAIDEINQNGGLLNKKLEPILIDGASDPAIFEAGALELINEKKVDVVFGCWTSASRKTVKPLFEKYDNLLIYPVQFEGLETSPNIFYTGLIPNQQVIPAVKWVIDNIGTRVYLVGSDYVYPRATNTLIKDMLFSLNIEILGEAYITLGSAEFSEVIDDIKKKRPDIIINTINGESNLHFFKSLQESGVSSKESPVLSFSLSENEYKYFVQNGINTQGHYSASGYLLSDQKKKDLDLIQRFQAYLKEKIQMTDPMISAYVGVNLWAKAVKTNRTSNPKIIKNAILKQSLEGPEGTIFADRIERKLFRHIGLGRLDEKGAIHKLWEYDKPIGPITFPAYRSKEEWETFMNLLFEEYDQKWGC